MQVEFQVSEIFQITPETLYSAWLDSEIHSRMTGGKAVINNRVGGDFSAWDGYITGVTLALQSPIRIVQSWRTSDFGEEDEDSLLEITFHPEQAGTKLIICHTHLPAHGEKYQQGWIEAYFTPMKAYFD